MDEALPIVRSFCQNVVQAFTSGLNLKHRWWRSRWSPSASKCQRTSEQFASWSAAAGDLSETRSFWKIPNCRETRQASKLDNPMPRKVSGNALVPPTCNRILFVSRQWSCNCWRRCNWRIGVGWVWIARLRRQHCYNANNGRPQRSEFFFGLFSLRIFVCFNKTFVCLTPVMTPTQPQFASK